MATRFILIRHGQTEWNASGRFMGQLDIPLDETGIRQAEAVSRRLSSFRPDAIYASDLSRAWETAQAIQSAIAASIHETSESIPMPVLNPEPRLREMNFGDWQGLTYPEIREKYPRELEAWEADITNCNPPGGENMAQMSSRIAAAAEEIRQKHLDQTVILVAHGGSLQTLITLSLEINPAREWQFPLRNTSLTEIQFYPDGTILNLFNDTCHLVGL